MTELHIFEEAQDLYADAADRVCAAARRALGLRGRFTLVLSGGSTPKPLYVLLGSDPYSDRINWGATHLFWSDERMVPISDDMSNYRMVAESLLSRVDVPSENIHRVRTNLTTEEAAQAYDRELRAYFGASAAFDLVLLGMGADGHTASLFPGSRVLGEGERLALPVLETRPQRVTLTLPALNDACEILFLVTGAEKARALAEVLEGPPNVELPAALVHPVQGDVRWLVDRPAARLLKRRAQDTSEQRSQGSESRTA